MHRRRLLCCLLVPLAFGCESNTERPPDPILAPTPVPVVAPPTRIEYRVTGTLPNAAITYVSSTQGTTQVTTQLPWFLSYQTTQPATFVYLSADADPFNATEGTLIVQVYVDGVLFREARARGFTPSVAVSGEVVR
jgi:hypothetical protein